MSGDEDFRATAAQIPVISAGWRFLEPFYELRSLGQAWPHVDPVLRLCWGQWWVHANRAALTADGYELDEVADALTDKNARNELWPDFDQVIIRDFSAAFPLDPSTWGIGTAPRVLAADVELLYVHRDIPEGGFWPASASAEVVPLVLRLGEGGWRVLNLGSERLPEPGWARQPVAGHAAFPLMALDLTGIAPRVSAAVACR